MIGLKSISIMGRTLAYGSVVAGLVLGASPRAGAEGVSFNDTIWPILQERCLSCHGGDKDKGDLKLDSLESFTKGGENGPIFVAGKPEESALYKLTILPKDDPDIMPAKGDPLTEEQTKAIHTWITEGANFGDWKGGAAPADQAAAPVDVLEVLAQNTAPADPAQLEAVSGLGGLAMPLDMKTPLVRVDYHLVGDTIGDEQLATLTPLCNQLTWLNLAGTKVTDAGLATVAGLSKVTRLHLERTGITDAGLAHLAGLTNLEYLNLYGTKVTDAGLAQLASLTNLKKIFLWQTGVTAAGADALKAALPNVKVDLGIDPAAIPSTEVAKVIPKEMFTADSCCAKAAAENKVCDHPCCVEAWAAKTACAKCNPKGAATPEPAAAPAVAKADEGSCCAKAQAEGKECDHPCCVEARAAGKSCPKCNPVAAEAALAYDDGSCCAKSRGESKVCDHPCCVEARATGKACAKCNPKVAAASAPVALKFKDGSCCATAQAASKECDHPCCVEARTAGAVCKKCNPDVA